jgi:hypothetical protein
MVVGAAETQRPCKKQEGFFIFYFLFVAFVDGSNG